MAIGIGRRQFISALSGAAVAWPLAAGAQQSKRVRRVGVLLLVGVGADAKPQSEEFFRAFQEALRALGWIDGQNIQIDFRGAADLESMRSSAAELISLGPELIVTGTTPATSAVRQGTNTVPIVFVSVSDPIGTGFVESFSRPGGNITGFTNFEATMGGKWLGQLKQIAPSIRRVSMLFNPETANAGASGGVYLPSIEAGARALSIELIVNPVHKPADIDDVFAAIAQSPDGGLIVMPNAFFSSIRERVVEQAARFNIPTVYPFVQYVKIGGLLCYAVDVPDTWRRAASYVDRILKGEKPANLPVQAPTKYELVINLKTARALGLTVPQSLLATADEVIE
jgi:putative ABC transport system substrate-binding protein